MGVGIVSEIKFNVQKMSKQQKPYTVTQLVYFTEGGAKKTENCFSDCDFASVLKELAPGDKINAKYTKNGDFFNLVGVELVEKGNGVAPTLNVGGGATGGTTSGTKGGGSYQKDPETQMMIIRQNALTNAVHFVTSTGVFETLRKGKETPPFDFVADLIITTATKFEGYTSGKVQEKSLTEAVGSVTHSSDIPDPA